jgi:hypothetical protein
MPKEAKMHKKLKQRRQKYHRNTQAIDAHGVTDVVGRNPGVIFHELKSGTARSKFLNSQIAISSGGTVATADTQRISLALFGSASTIAAPATGMKVM